MISVIFRLIFERFLVAQSSCLKTSKICIRIGNKSSSLPADPDVDERDVPDTSYYQWVVFFLLLQAGLFALPSWMWKVAESGVVKDFGVQDAKSALVLSDQVQLEKLVARFVKHFKSILHR